MPDHDHDLDERQQRLFPVRLPTDLYDAFYQMFPEYGARSLFIREAIRAALRQKGRITESDAAKIALSSRMLSLKSGQK